MRERDDAAPTGDRIDGHILTLPEARALAVIAQRLDRRPPAARDPATIKARLLETIRALGCVQIDTISVISRSHETVLWSRVGPYDPKLLGELHHPDQALFEYWAHAAAIVPIETFPYYRHYMTRYRERAEQPGSWADQLAPTLDRVLARIREQGPAASRHFERPDGPRPAPWTWYGGKPDREALDLLWSRGDLMVLRREGFQRIYDLTERVLPGAFSDEAPPEAERRRHFVQHALSALGVATPGSVADYFRSGARAHVAAATAAAELAALEAEGLAVRIAVDGWSEPTWLDPSLLPRLDSLRAGRGRPTLTTLLSPFDNLIWHRGRTQALFGFHHWHECYTPAAKRRYGYYNLPILHRGQLVGRLDPSYDRRARVLTVKAIHLEPGVRPSEALAGAIAGALADLVTFLGGGAITVAKSEPSSLAPVVTAALANR